MVFYIWLATVFFLATSLRALVFCTRVLTLSTQEDSIWETVKLQVDPLGRTFVLHAADVLLFLVFYVVMVLVFILMTILLVSQLTNAAQNRTSIEVACETWNPYDLGSVLANVAQIFGSLGSDWLFPVMPSRPLSDGFSFPRLSTNVLVSRTGDAFRSLASFEQEPYFGEIGASAMQKSRYDLLSRSSTDGNRPRMPMVPLRRSPSYDIIL